MEKPENEKWKLLDSLKSRRSEISDISKMSGTVLELKTIDIGFMLILGSKCEWILFEVKDFEEDLQTWRFFKKKNKYKCHFWIIKIARTCWRKLH